MMLRTSKIVNGLLFAAMILVPSSLPAADDVNLKSYDLANTVITPFIRGGPRSDLLAQCQSALADHTAGVYQKDFESLVAALEHEPLPPKGYDKKPVDRTADETIRAAIYDLTGDGAAAPDYVRPRDILVAAGTAALGPLIEALEDATPSRYVGEEDGPSRMVLLRREDLALSCIQEIAQHGFYNRTQGRGTQFHNDPQRARFLADIQAWWKVAQGKSQVELLHMEVDQLGQDDSAQQTLLLIALLEGPEKVLKPLRESVVSGQASYVGPVMLSILELDPPPLFREALERFRSHHATNNDYYILARYGDKKIYQELGKEAQADQGPWGRGDLGIDATTAGQNWALPIAAAILAQTTMDTATYSRPLCPADFVMESFQKYSGQDFGYKFDGPVDQRVTAINRAHDWWIAGGQISLAEKISEDHPTPYDNSDLFAPDAQLTAAVAAISANDDATARAAIAALPRSYSVVVQRALLSRLAHEPLAKERVAIIEKIGHASLWHAPVLSGFLERDPDSGVRLAAAKAIVEISFWKPLETCQVLLAAARKVADDPQTPPALQLITAHILLKGDSTLDNQRLKRLATSFPDDAELKRFSEIHARSNASPSPFDW